MKIILPSVLLMLIVGCATRHAAHYPPQIQGAIQHYEAVTPSMSRADVYRLLGQPQKTSAEVIEQWTVYDGGQTAVLSIRFGPDGVVAHRDFHIDNPGNFIIQP
jgi:hypothetical protein